MIFVIYTNLIIMIMKKLFEIIEFTSKVLYIVEILYKNKIKNNNNKDSEKNIYLLRFLFSNPHTTIFNINYFYYQILMKIIC